MSGSHYVFRTHWFGPDAEPLLLKMVAHEPKPEPLGVTSILSLKLAYMLKIFSTLAFLKKVPKMYAFRLFGSDERLM